MNNKSDARSTEDFKQLLEEMRGVKSEIDQKAQRLYALSLRLSQGARRIPDDIAPTYILYANAWQRFAGMVNQGMKRNVAVDRVLKCALDRKSEEKENAVEALRSKHSPKTQSYVHAPTNDDFAELFGELTNVE